jgi:hypothetical protein
MCLEQFEGRVASWLAVVSLILGGAACGDDGGGSDDPDAAPQGNELGPLSDSDSAADEVLEGLPVGTAVGLTLVAEDPNADDTVSYSLTNDAGGRFAIDSSTGVVTLASVLDF